MTALQAAKTALVESWWGRILAEHDTEPTELGSSFLKLFLGLLLIVPVSTFSATPVYGLLNLMPEWLWALVLIVIGLIHLIALRSGHRQRRRMSAAIGFVIWSCFSLSFLIGNPTNTGWIVYLTAASGQAWCYVRLSAKRSCDG